MVKDKLEIEWLIAERDELLQQVGDIEYDLLELADAYDVLDDANIELQSRVRHLKQSESEQNLQLRDRCMQFLNVIEELDKQRPDPGRLTILKRKAGIII